MSSYFSEKGSFRSQRTSEDVDPMSSLSNIGDVMLVFACGLMVALVAAWNVNLAEFTQVEPTQEVDASDIEKITENLYGEGNSFVERGKVYQDPTTGKFYLVETDDGESG